MIAAPAPPSTSPQSHGSQEPLNSTLLAVRLAAWPFEDVRMRSPSLDHLIDTRRQIETELSELSIQLSAALHALVPHASSDTNRHHLLALKRATHNQRPLPARPALEGFTVRSLESALSRYSELCRMRDTPVSGLSERIDQEVCEQLSDRVSRPDFRSALAASSVTLWEAVMRAEKRGLPLSPRDCRSLYAYVSRFTAKVNPLHLFTRLVPGARLWEAAPPSFNGCEITFDVEALLDLERRVLPAAARMDRVRLSLRPMRRKGDSWEVWLGGTAGLTVATVADRSLLQRVHQFFLERPNNAATPTCSVKELQTLLSESDDDPQAMSRARAAIDALIARGIIEPYLIEDLCAPAPALAGIDPTAEAAIACISDWHLRRTSADCVVRLESQVREADANSGAHGACRLPYFVNSYANHSLIQIEALTHRVMQTLADLKPILTFESNFAPVQRVFQSFVRTELAQGHEIAYLDLLARFLRQRRDLLQRLEWGRSDAYERLAARCRLIRGTLTSVELHPLLPPARRELPSVCFTGPFDLGHRRFFMSNIFAGDHRFASRYLLARAPAITPDVPSQPLDVELALPRRHSLAFVTRRYATGFGFDSRWAHGYRHWLGPERLLVRLETGTPVFHDTVTGRRLRFHYRGLLLATHLPVEYQLVLHDHADTYQNPFADDAPRVSGLDFEYREGVHFGNVTLRRDAWWLGAAAVRCALRDSDSASLSVALRRFVQKHLRDEELWFYHLPGTGRHGEKPRLLDLGSPLSVLAFRHALTNAANDVVLSRMEPGPEGLWQVGGRPHVSELMIEV